MTNQPEAVEPDDAAPADAPPADEPIEAPRPRPVPRPPARPHPPAVTQPPPSTPPGGAAGPDRGGIPTEHAREWGRVDETGTVLVRTDDGERPVGSYPDVTPDEALAYFGRKYDELVAQIDLAEQRLGAADAPLPEVGRTVSRLRSSLADAKVVGDIAALAARLDTLTGQVARRRKAAEAERAMVKEAARERRAALVTEAEAIAATDAERMQWKPAGDRLRVLFDEWKEAQRTGPRLDKHDEDDLWKRFGHARSLFDRMRRSHFSQLDQRHGEAKAVKTAIVAEAEALVTSKDWGATAAAYRELMERWKGAGRAGRRDDDALWARFRGAQDQFFGARAADLAVADQEFTANLAAKKGLLAEAEALLPVTDLNAAKAALRNIQDGWEAAGKVPRADLQRLEKRIRAVEEAVRRTDEERWSRSNPETKARAQGALGQLEDTIATLERDLDAARACGDARAERDAQQSLDARRAWLEQVRRAADDHS